MSNRKITRSQFLGTTLGLSAITSVNLEGSSLGRLMLKKTETFEANEKIRHAWEVALKILQPTKSQLEHGLELHANSLVFDSYGFQPTAAVDGAAIVAALKDGASNREISSMSDDMEITGFVKNEKERKEFENAWRASGVTCVFQNADELEQFIYVTDMLHDFVRKARTPEDIVLAKKENKHALYFSLNSVPTPEKYVSVEEELLLIKRNFLLGYRMMHLTYNRRNLIGDGCAETANAGLSDFGRSVVKELNRTGVIVDIAHSGWQTSLEAALVSEKPMVASHTTVASLNKVIRSKPDEVIKAIANTGGYIGICCVPRFLGGTGDIAALMKHIDYVAKTFGHDHVSIGTDYTFRSPYDSVENMIINDSGLGKQPSRNVWWNYWLDEPKFDLKPGMQESMEWTNWPLFTVGLVQMGYSDENIQKIIGGNVMRVTRAALEL